jgi:predicted heme/steroid binding protein
LTAEELKKYDGSEGSPGLYLAILGEIFDVSAGKEHYQPGGGYSFFTAKDGSRAFVSGKFSEDGLTDNLEGLSHQDYLGLDDW